MPHQCAACLVTCEDYRLHRRRDGRNAIGDYLARLGADCDLVTRSGAVQDLIRPMPGSDASLLRDLAVAVDLHGIRAIHLVNHEDCGGYRGMTFESREAELARHRRDLLAARDVLRRRFPGVEVTIALARLAPGGDDDFIVEPLNA